MTMLFRQANIRRAKQLAAAGQFNQAAALVLKFGLADSNSGREFSRSLVQQLNERSKSYAGQGDFESAWRDLNDASRIGNTFDQRAVVQQRQTLVEQTIQTAEQHLAAGNLLAADQAIVQLERQHILDRRADQIRWMIQQVDAADADAESGRWAQAETALGQALQRRSDLPWLAARSAQLQKRIQRADGLSEMLKDALLESNWSEAKRVSNELLGIAPNHPIAVDALRRCCAVHVPKVQRPVELSSQCSVEPVRNTAVAQAPLEAGQRRILWVDSVGGFLLCMSPEIMLGRAVAESGVDVPIIGDLSRRHAKITRSRNDYVLTPFAKTQIDGQTVSAPTLLKHGQLITLGNHVQIRFTRPHRYSGTARLDIISRHRTQPWSDAILLVAESLILGSRPVCHIVDPDATRQLILAFRDGRWHFRYDGNIDSAGRVLRSGDEVPIGCRFVADGLSMTLESS